MNDEKFIAQSDNFSDIKTPEKNIKEMQELLDTYKELLTIVSNG